MTITGGNSIYEQARDEGGIVDWMIDDMKETNRQLNKGRKKGIKKNINPKTRKNLIRRMERDLKALKSMRP